jgi:predicted oxidoreductase
MKTIPIGKSGLLTTRLAYGCWRLAGVKDPKLVTASHEEAGIKAVLAAFDAGYTLYDHADIYCNGAAETIFGKALKQAPSKRSEILIATKCGIRWPGDPAPSSPHRFDFSASHILYSCDQSLKRLGVETIDLYQLHRPDYLMDPGEVASAFCQLKSAGKARYFGVSNFRPSQLTALQSACPMPLLVNQVEISLGKLDCFNDGTLDQCLTRQITPLAWSPLAGGLLGTGAAAPQNDPRQARILDIQQTLDTIAKERSTTRTVIALAWLMKHPAGIVPIVGSTKPERIREAVQADNIDLSRDEWYRLLLAARGEKLP